MKKLTLISSLLGSAFVFGCGDDGKANSSTAPTTNSSQQTTDGTDSNSTAGSTGGEVSASTPTTEALTSGAGGSTGGTMGSFLVPTDMAGTTMCDVWAQDCPEGQKCMPASLDGDSSWESLICTAVMPNPGQPGDECTVEGPVTGVDSCDKGSMCWNVSADTGKGTCVEQCKGSQMAPMCSDPSTSCVIANDGVLTLCLPGCDPLAQDCPNNDLCIPNPMGDGFVCVLDASGDMGKEWDPCGYANACDPGLICANVALAMECPQDAQGCCLPFCDTSVMPAMCNGAGQECLPWYEPGMAPPGLDVVGICGIPM